MLVYWNTNFNSFLPVEGTNVLLCCIYDVF